MVSVEDIVDDPKDQSLIQYYYYLAINCTVVSLCDIQPQWCKCINVTRSAKRGLIGCRNSKFRFTCLFVKYVVSFKKKIIFPSILTTNSRVMMF